MNEAHLVRAAFLMLAGKSVASVSEEFKICRTSLYRLRRRAMDAVRREIERPTKNRKPAHNRIPQEKENKIVRLCQRHSALSSYRISQKFQQTEGYRMQQTAFCLKSQRGGEILEFDALGIADVEAVVVEVRCRVRESDFKDFAAKLVRFPRFFPAYAAKKLYGVIVAANVPDEIQRRATEFGFGIIIITRRNFITVEVLPTVSNLVSASFFADFEFIR